MITSAPAGKGIWSGKVLPGQPYGNGKRGGSGKRQEVCYRQMETLFLKYPRVDWNIGSF